MRNEDFQLLVLVTLILGFFGLSTIPWIIALTIRRHLVTGFGFTGMVLGLGSFFLIWCIACDEILDLELLPRSLSRGETVIPLMLFSATCLVVTQALLGLQLWLHRREFLTLQERLDGTEWERQRADI